MLAVEHAPIVGIDALADNQIAHVLCERKLSHFFSIFRLMVDAIRRTEENRFDAEGAFDEAFGEIELPLEFGVRDFVEFRMREGVITDFVAFSEFALEDFRMLVGFVADDKENGRSVFLFKNIQDLRRPAGVGTVVERENELLVI